MNGQKVVHPSVRRYLEALLSATKPPPSKILNVSSRKQQRTKPILHFLFQQACEQHGCTPSHYPSTMEHSASRTTTDISGTTTAADAEFLSQLSSSSAVGDLHKSNLLRLQVDELVQASAVDYMHVKWHAAAQDYMTHVSSIIEGLPLDKITSWHDPKCPWTSCTTMTTKKKNTQQSLSPPPSFRSSSRLRTKVTGCTAADGLGLLTTASNAKVLPTLHLRVSLPAAELLPPGSKDYLKHKYFQVRLYVWCIYCMAVWQVI